MASNPSHVVSWDLFQHNQLPYLELRRPFILGSAEAQWRPTVAHFFVRVCADRGLLQRLYTQNIDGLDQVLALLGCRFTRGDRVCVCVCVCAFGLFTQVANTLNEPANPMSSSDPCLNFCS